MFSLISQQHLRIAAIFILGSLLSACAHYDPACARVANEDELWCAPEDDGYMGCFHAPKGSTICPVSYNVVQCFFSAADLQAETQSQLREIRRALTDALELPIEELRKPRYADYTMVPNQWTFDELISRYFLGVALIRGWGHVDPDTNGFYPALKLPESIPVLKRRIEEVERAIPSSVGD
jgi:hypothetical protein